MISVSFFLGGGEGQFDDGRVEWGAMAFNGGRRRVFPLAPTACAHAKLNGYFGKLQNSEGDFGLNLSVLDVL